MPPVPRPSDPAQVVVRPAVDGDVDELAALAALTFPLACPPGTDPEAIARHVATELPPSRFVAWLHDTDSLVLVASRAGSPAVLGYTLVLRGVAASADVAQLVGAGTTVELSKIYVHPDEQGSGLARVLLHESLATAADRFRTSSVWLGTNGQNLRAQAFYRRHGFVLAGPRTYLVGGQAHEDVVMVADLDLPGAQSAPDENAASNAAPGASNA
ncbi:GNAT family N-acetyltransferase [Sediminihabitans luteus]|nr:GNAT family N-acetyltransferase [Sediminihabitans luteus]